jgi:hypothetical protein
MKGGAGIVAPVNNGWGGSGVGEATVGMAGLGVEDVNEGAKAAGEAGVGGTGGKKKGKGKQLLFSVSARPG